MSEEPRITEELSIGDLISRTFHLFARDFESYFVVFLVVGIVTGVLSTALSGVIVISSLPSGAPTSQVLSYLAGVLELAVLTAIVSWIVGSVATGAAVRMASVVIQGGQADWNASVKFTFSKIIPIWIVELVVGLIVFLGVLALIVPGIILYIMFSLAVPVLLIEGTDILPSMARSRKLVGNRWLKTFGYLLIIGIVMGIASLIVGVIGGLFGPASTVVKDALSALYMPILPIGLTVYYYSNAARLEPPPAQPVAPPVQASVKFCPGCGTQLSASSLFCPKCGAKQPS